MTPADGAERPVLRVVHGGDPAPEELAALVTAVLARAAVTVQPPPRRVGGWDSRGHGVRRPMTPGPGAWVASTRPR